MRDYDVDCTERQASGTAEGQIFILDSMNCHRELKERVLKSDNLVTGLMPEEQRNGILPFSMVERTVLKVRAKGLWFYH